MPFGVPNGGLYKYRERLPEALAKEDREYLWQFDERGSFNAVCGYLRSLGARWYLPGEFGEIVPKMKSIPLPKIDETVKPNFEVRQFSVRFATADEKVMRWAMRLRIPRNKITLPNSLTKLWNRLVGSKKSANFVRNLGGDSELAQVNERVHYRAKNIGATNNISHRLGRMAIRTANYLPHWQTAADKYQGTQIAPMTASAFFLDLRSAAEFSHNDHEDFIAQTAIVQILQKRGCGLVNSRR